MTPVEDIDLPTMSDVCLHSYGIDCCECIEHNYPDACPCGEASSEGDPTS